MRLSLDNPLVKNLTLLESVPSRELNKGVETQGTGISSTTQPGAPQETQKSQSDRVTISEDALRKLGLLKAESKRDEAKSSDLSGDKNNKDNSASANTQETRRLETLKRTDREVRAHEQAHISAGGSLVRGGASFGYATGSDGKLYAVNGEVSIDSSPVSDDPAATIRKMSQVTRAALAPSQPSGQDRSVASSATKMQMEAQQELTKQQMEAAQSGGKSEQTASGGNESGSKSKAASGLSAKESDSVLLPTGKLVAKETDTKSNLAGALGVKGSDVKTLPTGKLTAKESETKSSLSGALGIKASDLKTLPTGKLAAKESETKSSLSGSSGVKTSDFKSLPTGKLAAKELDSKPTVLGSPGTNASDAQLLPTGKLPAKETDSTLNPASIFNAYNMIQPFINQTGLQKQNNSIYKRINISA